MKKWLFYALAVALVAITGYMPFSGSDVAKLQPVELIRVGYTDDRLTVQTDTGDFGYGQTVAQALGKLKETTAGEVFLDTADFVLVDSGAEHCLDQLTGFLRPACKVCLVDADMKLSAAAEFLRIHSRDFTLQDYRAGKKNIPYLGVEEERFYFVSKEG